MFRLTNGWCIGCAAMLLLTSCRFDRTGLEPGDVGSATDVTMDMRPDAQIYDLGPDLVSGLDLSLVKPPDGVGGDGLSPSYTAANIAPTWWAYGTGDLTVSASTTLTIDTSNNSTTPPLPPGVGLYNDYNGTYTILTLHDLKVEHTGTLRGIGSRPLIIVAGGAVTIDGLVNIAATGKNPGPGGQFGGGRAKAGSGCGGGTQGELKVLDYDSGGAGASFGGKGGQGGDGPLAKPPCTLGCSEHCVIYCLTPLRGGSGGGGGGDVVGGEGGAGGGALQISARDVITVGLKGVINAAGGTGGGGSGVGGSGAGGGSGGGILLEAPTVNVSGTVAANGGGGGGGGAAFLAGKSGDDGKALGTAASGGDGANELFGANIGGKGGAGSSTGDGNENAGNGKTGSGLEYGQGGGGGGSGRICIRNRSGTVGGTISPRSTNLQSVPYALLPL